MKPRSLSRQELANELKRAGRLENPYSPNPAQLRAARHLLGDGKWAEPHYYTPEIDPQGIADAWVAAESKLQRVMIIGPFVFKLPRRQSRPIQITD